MNWLTRTNDRKDLVKCKNLSKQIAEYIKERADRVTVSMSGGVDSTVMTALSVMAVGNSNVYGIHLPYSSVDTDCGKFNARSQNTAKFLGINDITIPITAISDALLSSFGTEIDDLTRGNTNARLRMAAEYAYNSLIGQNGVRARVTNNCNLGEDAVAYFSIWGDGCGDLAPMASLHKREVYDLADYLIFEGILRDVDVDRVPSAGLWNDQSDEGEIGYSYDDMAPYVDAMLTNRGYDGVKNYTEDDFKALIVAAGLEYNECAKTVVSMHIKGRYKLYTMDRLNLANRI